MNVLHTASALPRAGWWPWSLALIAAAVGIAGCQSRPAAGAGQDSSASQNSPPPDFSNAAQGAMQQVSSITLERGPCFGTCPVYTLRIAGDGAIQFNGIRFVARAGMVTDSIPRDSVTALAAELEKGGYFDFADRYVYGEPACTMYVTDLPTVTTSVTIGERSKSIVHDRGCGSAPARLSQLENRIDSVARVWRWTTGGPPQ